MSLICHTIVSHYTAQEGDTVEKEADRDEQDPWITERSFDNARRLHSKAAPAFVRATMECDEYGMPRKGGEDVHMDDGQMKYEEDISGWYRSLTASRRENVSEWVAVSCVRALKAEEAIGGSHSEHSNIQAIDATDNSSTVTSTTSHHSGGDWFTSCPLTDPNPATTSKPSTLADIFSRHPPPLPSEPVFIPPVFLSIGPANRGFQMLQRKGWEEGEGLGSGRVEKRRVRLKEQATKVKKDAGSTFPFTEIIDLTMDDSDGESKTPPSSVPEVVDLTFDSDYVDDEAKPRCSDNHSEYQNGSQSPEPNNVPTTHGIALITPLSTTLKADRLGIGLKVRHHSKMKAKAITHTSAALAAHIRTANQSKKEKGRFGRGWRGLARKNKKEEKERVEMLKYLNN